jgi:hypothetical protein
MVAIGSGRKDQKAYARSGGGIIAQKTPLPDFADREDQKPNKRVTYLIC